MTTLNYLNYSNCSYQQVSNDSNFFQGLYDHKFSQTISVVFSTVGSFTLIPLLYGIIWYERYGSDNKRTLLNKFVSSLCWACLEYILFCQIPDIVIHIFGPTSHIICWVLMSLKLIIPIQVLLIMNGIIITRYFFIFWLKNPVAFNDDFWSFFLTIWIVGFLVMSQFIFIMVSTKKILFYHICVGKVPDEEQNYPTEDGPLLFHILFAFIVHFVILFRISVYKIKSKFLNFNSSNSGNNLTFSSQIVKESLSDMTTTICTATIYFCTAIFTYFMHKIPLRQFNCFPTYLFEYFLRLIWPITFISSLVILHYCRNGKLRSTLKMELVNYF